MKKIVLIAASTLLVSVLSANQVNMDKAADHLKQAKAYLKKATKNKGGFRTKAINSVDRALQQIEKGKKAALKKKRKKDKKKDKKKEMKKEAKN